MALLPGRDMLRALIAKSSGRINFNTPNDSLRLARVVLA